MERTLIDKTSREEHTISKLAESRMLVDRGTLEAAKALREEDIKLRPATLNNPVLVPETGIKSKPKIENKSKSDLSEKKEYKGRINKDKQLGTNAEPETINEQKLTMSPSRPQTSNMRDMSNDNEAEP